MESNNLYRHMLSLANENPACHLATMEDNQPRVRGLLMWFADESGFYFHTGATKRLPNQLRDNPKVEIAFLKPTQDPSQSEALRVTGIAEFINDPDLEERLLTERPWLKAFESVSPNNKPVIFRVRNGEAFIWNMTVNCREETAERIKI